MRQSTTGSPTHTRGGPQAISDCSSFAELAKKVSALEALDRALRQTLPLPLREQVRFADLHHQRLVFLATSPVWASRLRLLQDQILASARAIGVGASSIKVKVVIPDPAPAQTDARKLLSSAAATHLRISAGSFQDPELRALFLALASRAAGASPT